jgi:uncharacterized protein YjbJ (UPF0337 family)
MRSRTDHTMGKVKQTVGGLTHNKAMKRRGRVQEATGRTRHFFGHLRKSVKRMR